MKKISNYLIQAHNLFLILVLISGFLLAVIIPPLWGTDETAHFARSYQLAHGDFSPPKSSNGAYGGNLPANLITLWNYTKSDLLDNTDPGALTRKDVDNEHIYKQLTAGSFSKQNKPSPGGAIYSPFAYPAPVVGIWVADIFHASIGTTILLARLCSLFLYAVLVWLALRLIVRSKLRWLVFSVALLPTCVYQASVVTADNMVIGLSLLIIAIFIRLVRDETKKSDKSKQRALFAGMIGVAVWLSLVKINYIFLALLIALVPMQSFGLRKKNLGYIVKAGSIGLAVIAGLVWSKISNAASSAAVSQRPDGLKVVPSDQILFLVHHPLSFLAVCVRSVTEMGDYYLRSLLGLIGWNYVFVPLLIIFILVVGLFAAAFYAKKELEEMRSKLIWMGLFVLGGIASTFGALYITFTPTGERIVEGVQGRYFIPFIVPIAMFIAGFLPMELRIKERAVPYIFGGINVLCLAVTVAYYYRLTYL